MQVGAYTINLLLFFFLVLHDLILTCWKEPRGTRYPIAPRLRNRSTAPTWPFDMAIWMGVPNCVVWFRSAFARCSISITARCPYLQHSDEKHLTVVK